MKPDGIFEPALEAESRLLGPLKFNTPAELGAWIEQHAAFANEIVGTVAAGDPALEQAWQAINGPIRRAQRQVAGANAQPNATSDPYREALASLVSHIDDQKLIAGETPEGSFLANLKDQEPALAARAYAVMSGVSFNLQTPASAAWLRAGALATAWQEGWIDRGSAFETTLETVYRKWDERFDAKLVAINGTAQALTGELNAITEEKTKWQTRLVEATEASATFIKAGGEKITAFESAYNQALALRAPTQYWRDKQRSHWMAAGGWFAAFAIGAVLSVIGVWYVWHVTVELRFTGPETAPYTGFIPSIGAALLGAWFMRMFSRQMISNLALGADAGERVAMVKTYLALTEGGHASESDRGLILSSLFRTAAKTSDDAAPPTAADALAKFLKGEKI